jgi:putative Mg2+ transporter-C (MgtC) family protein
MVLYPEDILKLLLALALGGMVGAEREFRDKDAGFRTLMFIAVGSAMFTILSIRIAGGQSDPARIAAQIVSGIGFLGAGVILREHGEVRGLTTAATIWLTAALGMAAGAGQFLFSGLAVLLILLALLLFPAVERQMGTLRQERTYIITTRASLEKHAALEVLARHHELTIVDARRARSDSESTCTWKIVGRPKQHEAFETELYNDPEVLRLEV